MIKFENTEVMGWENAIRGMRNPMNSWNKSDSEKCHILNELTEENKNFRCSGCKNEYVARPNCFIIGPNDFDLMKRLRNAGTDHRKFMRMITVYVDITAPLYWWKEFDTYKVGTVANSCSTMHKIAAKEFTLDDFSTEHLIDLDENYHCKCEMDVEYDELGRFATTPLSLFEDIITMLNVARKKYLKTKDKEIWWQMIQLLPSSYNQKRTVMMNYEVLANIYKSRKNHKLDEWSEHKVELVGDCPSNMYPTNMIVKRPGFCDWIKTLPYAELITGEYKGD